jgi:hypothetical protein
MYRVAVQVPAQRVVSTVVNAVRAQVVDAIHSARDSAHRVVLSAMHRLSHMCHMTSYVSQATELRALVLQPVK